MFLPVENHILLNGECGPLTEEPTPAGTRPVDKVLGSWLSYIGVEVEPWRVGKLYQANVARLVRIEEREEAEATVNLSRHNHLFGAAMIDGQERTVDAETQAIDPKEARGR